MIKNQKNNAENRNWKLRSGKLVLLEWFVDPAIFEAFRTWTKVTEDMWFGRKAKHREGWLGQCLLCESWTQRLGTTFSNNQLRIIAGCYNHSHSAYHSGSSDLKTLGCALRPDMNAISSNFRKLWSQVSILTQSLYLVPSVCLAEAHCLPEGFWGNNELHTKCSMPVVIKKPWIRCQVTWA